MGRVDYLLFPAEEGCENCWKVLRSAGLYRALATAAELPPRQLRRGGVFLRCRFVQATSLRACFCHCDGVIPVACLKRLVKWLW